MHLALVYSTELASETPNVAIDYQRAAKHYIQAVELIFEAVKKKNGG